MGRKKNPVRLYRKGHIMSELTEKEEQYLRFIKAYIEGHGGLGPSYKDLTKAFDVVTPTAQYTMNKLKNSGAVRWSKRNMREMEVLR